MAAGRFTTLHEILKPRVVRWGGGGLVLLGFYDVLCNQLGLPTVKSLISKVAPFVGMTGALMPWWGWLLVLQALFVYALFEYVRASASPSRLVASVPDMPTSEPPSDLKREMADLKVALEKRFKEEVDRVTANLGPVERNLEIFLEREINRLMGAVIQDLLSYQPKFDKMKPPLDQKTREAQINEMQGWVRAVSQLQVSQYFGPDFQKNLSGYEKQGGVELRKIPPAEMGSDQIAFGDFFVAAFQSDATAAYLERGLQGIEENDRAGLLQLLKIQADRNKTQG